MLKPTGSARDPLPSEPNSSSSSTPGLGWVIAGFVAICIAVALVQNGGLQHTMELVTASGSSHG